MGCCASKSPAQLYLVPQPRGFEGQLPVGKADGSSASSTPMVTATAAAAFTDASALDAYVHQQQKMMPDACLEEELVDCDVAVDATERVRRTSVTLAAAEAAALAAAAAAAMAAVTAEKAATAAEFAAAEAAAVAATAAAARAAAAAKTAAATAAETAAATAAAIELLFAAAAAVAEAEKTKGVLAQTAAVARVAAVAAAVEEDATVDADRCVRVASRHSVCGRAAR